MFAIVTCPSKVVYILDALKLFFTTVEYNDKTIIGKNTNDNTRNWFDDFGYQGVSIQEWLEIFWIYVGVSKAIW